MTDIASDVEIIYDETTDITNHCVITQANFNVSAAAQPGTCELTLRDLDRELSFISGRRLKLRVDGQDLWSGFTMINGRSSFFSAGDGLEDTKARKWILRGVDNNVLWDRRVLRNPADYTHVIPDITTDTFDGDILKQGLSDYADMPSWLDISTFIDNVVIPSSNEAGTITSAEPWGWPQQGSRIRQLAEDLAQSSAAVYYIGPDDAVHFHAIQDVESPWGFSDRPNRLPITGGGGFEGAYWGFRELSGDEDGSEFATDAFVWGGSEFAGGGATVFARATDTDLEDIHGKWQLAETHFGERFFKTQPTVTQRANVIVFGNPDGDPAGAEPGSVTGEGPRGLRFPQWAYNFTWFEVPRISGVPRHIYPGSVVPIELWSFSEDAGVTPFRKWLPLRSLKISFPSGVASGQAIVRFDGGFDLRNQDSKFLWTYLRQRQKQAINPVVVVTNADSSAPYGAFGQFVPTPAPGGGETVFTVPFGYIAGTTSVWVSGVALELTTDYTESDPLAGEITLASAPAGSDHLFITDRTLAG